MNFGLASDITSRALPAVNRTIARQKLILRKNSPHILFGVGVVGMVSSTVLACRATLKLSDTMDEIEKDVVNVREARSALKEANSESSEYDFVSIRDVNRDTALIYVKAAAKLGRLYAPSILAGCVSIGAFGSAHVTLTRRNASLTAAYAAIQKAFEEYQDRVAAEFGEDKARELKADVLKYKDEETGEEIVIARGHLSPYARCFDSASPDWKKDPEQNRMFIMCNLQYANDRLRARGHLFLNEVYDSLGMERTPEGQMVGWVIGGKGDDYVSFNLDDPINARFMQGLERSPYLDFNVDGVVYDLI